MSAAGFEMSGDIARMSADIGRYPETLANVRRRRGSVEGYWRDVSGHLENVGRHSGFAGGAAAERHKKRRARAAPSRESRWGDSGYEAVSVSVGFAGGESGGGSFGSSGAGLATRVLPRKGCRWNSASFSERIP